MGSSCRHIISISLETLSATCICALGVTLFVEAGIGSDTIDVLIDGLHQSLSLTLGQADMIFSFIFLGLALLCNRQYIGLPSIAYTLMIGVMIDLINLFIIPLQLVTQPYLIRLLCVLLGEVCFALSYAIFQTIEKGMNTLDAVIYCIMKQFQLSYPIVRSLFELLFVALGFVLGGSIGVGTLISAVCSGVLTNRCFHIIVHLKKQKSLEINIE